MPPKKKGQPAYNSKGQRIDAMARKKDERAVKNSYRKERKAESYFADDENFACFATQLGKMGLQLREIPGDGNCLFRALGDQLEGHGRNHMAHRQEIVDYMQKHRADFEPFVEDDVPFERHTALLKKPGTYAGNDAIVAFARLRKLNVVIHQLSSPCWTIQGTDGPNPKQLHISYHNGDHYSSVRRAGDTMEQPANIVLLDGKPQVEQPTHSKKGKPSNTSVISNGSYMHEAYTGSSGFGGYAGDYGKNHVYEEHSATFTWDPVDNEESHIGSVRTPDPATVPGSQMGMARAIRNPEDVIVNVMKATGCQDAKLVQETLEDQFYDVDTTIAFILQIMATSSPTNGYPADSFSVANMGSSSDSGIWSENGTGSRVFGGYDSATMNSTGAKPKLKHVSASKTKRDKKLEKKIRATERRRQQFLGDGPPGPGYHGDIYDEDTHQVTDNMGMLTI